TQWGDPVFAALAPTADVCPAVQCHVTAVEPGELRNPQSSLEGEDQESVVAPPDPSGTIQATDQAVHFFLGEVGDDSPIGPLGWNGEYSLYKRGVFRMAVGGEAEQGAHSGQTCIARADADPPLSFQVREEGAEHGCVEIGEAKLQRRLAELGVAEGH